MGSVCVLAAAGAYGIGAWARASNVSTACATFALDVTGRGCVRLSRDITERPRAPSGVAAFMSAHSKTPYITPSMDFSSGKGVVRGRRGQQLGLACATRKD